MLHTVAEADADKGVAMDFAIVHQECPTKIVMLQDTTVAKGHVDSIIHDVARDPCPSTNWVIQKFGGTSFGKCAVTIAAEIVLYVAARLYRKPRRLKETGQASEGTRSPLFVRHGAP